MQPGDHVDSGAGGEAPPAFPLLDLPPCVLTAILSTLSMEEQAQLMCVCPILKTAAEVRRRWWSRVLNLRLIGVGGGGVRGCGHSHPPVCSSPRRGGGEMLWVLLFAPPQLGPPRTIDGRPNVYASTPVTMFFTQPLYLQQAAMARRVTWSWPASREPDAAKVASVLRWAGGPDTDADRRLKLSGLMSHRC
jgi:hypothetical protein